MKKLLLAVIASAGLAAAAAGPAEAYFSKYGALAYNMATGAHGYTYGFNRDWMARKVALDYCGWNGCKVYLTFKNTCGALATDNAKGIYAFGWPQSFCAVAVPGSQPAFRCAG